MDWGGSDHFWGVGGVGGPQIIDFQQKKSRRKDFLLFFEMGLGLDFKVRLDTPAKVGVGAEGTLGPPTWLRFQIHLSRRPLGHIHSFFNKKKTFL